ncbi:beta strand repeat-containing protein [Lacisediminimonas profundi]|uniref:beta strand repeat-containing protein n=1 Tax=Lacisediminimonas profundi TaxID=2603856 RepID=UPI00124B05FD|nr:hypothetical protein [Lacisediminimonas profundi]
MAKKIKPTADLKKKKVARRRLGVELDKAGMAAAALGTFLAAQQVQAADKGKQSLDDRQADDLLAQAHDAELVAELPAELLSADLDQIAQELASLDAAEVAELTELGEVPASAEIPVADLDGTMLSQASPVADLPPGVDARTTMTDAGAGGAGGSAGSAAGAADAAAASSAASSAAGGAAGSGLASLGTVTLGSLTMPVGAIMGAGLATAAALATGGGSAAASVLSVALATTTGLVVDGNVRDATIFYDRNGNGKLDAGEISAKTKADGSYNMTGDAALMTGKLVVLGDGFDTLTGQKVGMMVAPEGFAFVSPLTTLVAAAGGDAASQNAMLAKLGISGAGLNGKSPLEFLKTYDPIKAMTSGTPAEKALAEKAFTVSQQVFSVIQTAAELQAKVGGTTSGLSDITSIASSIAKSISSAPATDGTGAAVSATSIINQAASKAVDAALTNASTEVREALQANVTRALSTVNSAIEQKYTGLATALTNSQANPTDAGSIQALAEKMAIAAVSQNTLITGIRAVDTTSATTLANSQDSLLIAGDKEALANLQTEVFVEAVKAGSTTATNDFLALSNPAIATSTKFTVVDTQANLVAYARAHVGDPASYLTKAVGVVVTDPINLAIAQELIDRIPTVAFRNPTVGDAAGTLTYTVAVNFLDAGIKFPPNLVTVSFTTGQLETVVDSAVELALGGVSTISVIGGTLGPANGFTLHEAYSLVDAGLHFAAGNTITVGVTSDELTQVAGLVTEFAAANIDAIGAETGSVLSVQLADAIAIANAGLSFTAGNTVTVLVGASDAAALASNIANLKTHGIDQIELNAGLTDFTLDYSQASLLATAALPFTGGNIVVNVTAGEVGTMNAAAFHAIGVDSLTVLGATPTLALTTLTPVLAQSIGLTNGAQVVVTVTTADSALLETSAVTLHAQGITTLAAAAATSLSLVSVQAAITNSMNFEAASDFTVLVPDASVATLVSSAAQLKAAGIDHVGAADGTLVLTVADAISIANAQLDFAATGTNVTVQFNPADIPALAAAADQLKAAGVDFIDSTVSNLTLSLGEAQNILGSGIAFDPLTTISLNVTQAELASLLNETLLVGKNIPLTVTDAPLVINAENAAALFDAGYKFAPSQVIELLVADAASLAAAVSHAAAFKAGGLPTLKFAPADQAALDDLLVSGTFATDIAALRTAGFVVDSLQITPVTITDSQVQPLLAANLTFGDPATAAVTFDAADAPGGLLQSTLKDLQKLAVDNVLVSSFSGQYQIELDLGTTGTLSAAGLPVFAPILHVALNITDLQLDEITGTPGLASALAQNGVDWLQSDGDVLIQMADAVELLGTDQVSYADDLYVIGDNVSFDLVDSDLPDVVTHAQALAQIGVDDIDVRDNTLTLSDSDASSLVSAGLHFSADDTGIVVDSAATTLSTSLKDLQKLGVDQVSLNGGDIGNMHVQLGEGTLSGTLPTFGNTLTVDLGFSDLQLQEVVDNGAALKAAGVDFLVNDDHSFNMTLAQANTLLGNDGVFDAATDLGFGASENIIMGFNGALPGAVNTVASEAAALADLGVDHLHSSTGAVTLSDAQAGAIIGEGLNFVVNDEVTVQAEATHMTTSLKDLQKLGVDTVLAPDAASVLKVGLGAGLFGAGALPVFGDTDGDGTLSGLEDSALDVTLNVMDPASLAGRADSFADAGIDHIQVNGGQATLDVAQLEQWMSSTVDFTDGTDLTLTVTEADIGLLADNAAQVHDYGVNTLDVAGVNASLTLGAGDAAALVQAGLEFEATDTVTVDVTGAEGTHLSTSLKDLQKLGVDHVSLSGGADAAGTLTVELGDSTVFGGALTSFDQGDHITLSISGADGDGMVAHVAELTAAGIDTIFVNDETNVNVGMADAQAILGGDLSYDLGDLQISADNNVSLEIGGDVDLDSVLQGLTGVQGLGVDHIEAGGSAVSISDQDANDLVHAGLDFSQSSSDVTLAVDATQGEATHLSTTLKDLQKLGVDHVSLAGAADLAVDLGHGDLGVGGLPTFDAGLNVTLNADASQMSELLGMANAGALNASNIDSIQLHGSAADFLGLDAGDLATAGVDGFTLDVTANDLAALNVGSLPTVGDVTVDKIDVAGFNGSAHIDMDTAQALVDAGISFEGLDHISLDVAAGAAGTQLATNFDDLNKLGVDHVNYKVDEFAPAIDANDLPMFDQRLDVTLDAPLPGTMDAAFGNALLAHGIDQVAINEDVAALFDEGGGNGLGDLLAALGSFTGTGIDLELQLQGGATPADANLDAELFGALSGFAAPGNYGDLINALTNSGVSDLVVETGSVQVTDGLLNALSDAGMLQALPATNMVLDATASGDRLFTSLRELADLDVDHVNASASGNLYIDLGELGDGNALAEVKELLTHLDADMFTGATTPTLVMDSKMAEALSDSGVFDADLLAGLEHIGIKEIGVLVGHNEHTSIVAQTVLPVEVKLIGQDADPMLFDDLHHPKQ